MCSFNLNIHLHVMILTFLNRMISFHYYDQELEQIYHAQYE